MKKFALAVVMLVGMTTLAQENGPKKETFDKLTTEQKVDFQLKRLTKELDLNEKQIKEIKEVVTKEVAKREAKRAEKEQNKAKKQERLAEAKANFEKDAAEADAQMKRILTAEQYAKWAQKKDERLNRMKEKMLEKKEERMNHKGGDLEKQE
jgi:Spy/CpxP family protein refolding chaperone